VLDRGGGEGFFAGETGGGVVADGGRGSLLGGAARGGRNERINTAGGERDDARAAEAGGDALRHLDVERVQQAGGGRGAELHAGEEKHRGGVGQRGELGRVGEIAGEGLDAARIEVGAIAQGAEPGDGDDPIGAAELCESAAEHDREMQTDLPAGTEHEERAGGASQHFEDTRGGLADEVVDGRGRARQRERR
jgi:hypothetical protein